MEGVGIYMWNDGRIYEGEYKDDKKHGYGVYKWADGRKYTGYWSRGKQHGLGKYMLETEDKIKYGLWEDGKRIKWFEQSDIAQINKNLLDYTQFFTLANSS